METLAKRAKYHDSECVNLFKMGAPIVGTLERSGTIQFLRDIFLMLHCFRGLVMARLSRRRPRSAWKNWERIGFARITG